MVKKKKADFKSHAQIIEEGRGNYCPRDGGVILQVENIFFPEFSRVTLPKMRSVPLKGTGTISHRMNTSFRLLIKSTFSNSEAVSLFHCIRPSVGNVLLGKKE